MVKFNFLSAACSVKGEGWGNAWNNEKQLNFHTQFSMTSFVHYPSMTRWKSSLIRESERSKLEKNKVQLTIMRIFPCQVSFSSQLLSSFYMQKSQKQQKFRCWWRAEMRWICSFIFPFFEDFLHFLLLPTLSYEADEKLKNNITKKEKKSKR